MVNKLQLTFCLLVILYLVSSFVCDINAYQKIQSERMIEIKREDKMKRIVQSRLNALIRLMETENIGSKNKERLTNLKQNLQL